MSQRAISKRKPHQISKANPLFEQWISEWLKEATEKNLEVRHGYQRVRTMNCFSFFNYWVPFHFYLSTSSLDKRENIDLCFVVSK